MTLSGEITTLVVDDLSRLSRSEDMPLLVSRLKYHGVHVLSSDGFDSNREDARLQSWVRGLVGNIYLEDLAKKTHRGLAGRAIQGNSAGGLAYGYGSVPIYEGRKVIGYGREIIDAEAQTVKRVFRRFAEGTSPRAIAEELNEAGIPSPRGSSWAFSAIYGHGTKGTGILNNESYIGREIWNRSTWIKNPLTGKRKRVERPREEWIVHENEELRIVPQELWDAVKERQNKSRERTSNLRLVNPAHTGGGRKPKYLLSGFLKCGACGAPFTLVNKDKYGCANHRNRGSSVCEVADTVKRQDLEHAVLQFLRHTLLSQAAFEHFVSEVRRMTTTDSRELQDVRADLKRTEEEIANILKAIKAGIVTETVKDELEKAEIRRDGLKEALTSFRQKPEALIPKAHETYIRYLDALAEGANVDSARGAIDELLGAITLTKCPESGEFLYSAERGGLSAEILVAGAGFEPTTFGL